MLNVLTIGPEDALLRHFIEQAPAVENLRICHRLTEYPAPEELIGQVEGIAPDAVVINLADYKRAVRSISGLFQAKPHLPIVALHTYCTQELLLELMQLGVRELWHSPFDLAHIRQAVERLCQQKAGEEAPHRPPGTLLAFLPARGGCGSTTVAVHTAAALQKTKGSVLLTDFDFHNSIIAFWTKITPRHGLHEALERAHWLDASQWRGMVTRFGDLDVLTAPQTSVPMVFSGAETSAVLEFSRQNYHYVLVDLPDAIYSSCWEVLAQADQILVVSTPEIPSLYLARRKSVQIVDHGIPKDRIRVLLNRCGPGDLKPAEIEEYLSLPVAASFGNHYRAATAAVAQGSLAPAGSRLGSQFTRFAESLAGPPERKEQPKGGLWRVRQMLSQT